MKATLKNSLIFFLIVFGFLLPANSSAQEDVDMSEYRVRFGFTSTKHADQSRVFQAEFTASHRKDRRNKIPIYGAEIQFLNFLDDEQVELGRVATSQEGIAEITLPAAHEYLTDSEGYMNFRAYFKGSDALDEESEELRIQNLHLKLDLVEIDSVQTVKVNAFTVDSLGMESPVNDAYVMLSVDGMLSRMVFEEDFIQHGELEIEFPQGLPGDTKGNITVFAVIADDDNFGNVIQTQSVGWGIPKAERTEMNNTLWSDVAPFWMYIVLTILLVGVWANFAYTIVNLIKIKKEGKKIALEAEKSE